MLYIIFFFFIARDTCCRHIIFRQISSIQSFVFFIFTPRPLILIMEARSLCGSSFFLIKYISAYLLNKNYVLCLLAHTMYQLCAVISLLQFSAALPPQVTKLVLLTNPKLSILFFIFSKCSSSFKIKKRKRIGDSGSFYRVSINI